MKTHHFYSLLQQQTCLASSPADQELLSVGELANHCMMNKCADDVYSIPSRY